MSTRQGAQSSFGIEEDSSLDPIILEPRKRACDACRTRKVRCSQEEPACQNCLGWKVTCIYSAKKRRPVQSNVSKTLEDVDARLLRMEQRLEERMDSLTNLLKVHNEGSCLMGNKVPAGTSSTDTAEKILPSLPPALVTDGKGKTHFVGVNSIMQMIAEAESGVRLRAHTIHQTPANKGPPVPVLELGNLDQSKLLADDAFDEVATTVSDPLEIPVNEHEATRICKLYFDFTNRFYPLFDEEIFLERLRSTFSQPDMLYDQAWFVCFSMVMVFGLSLESHGQEAHPHTPLIKQICGPAWKALSTYPCWPSSLLKVQALVAGAYVAQEISRPGLVWSLISSACQEAMAIGLQRDCDRTPSLSSAQRRDRKTAFWGLYILDRSLSLIFGRAFCLPDFDIDVSLPSDDSSIWMPSLTAWTRLAEIQGRIYQTLYSTKGLRTPTVNRSASVDALDAEIRRWWTQFGSVTFHGCVSSQFSQMDYARLEMKFNYHTTLVLLHNTTTSINISTGNNTSVCVVEARHAIGSIESALRDSPALAQSQLLLWLVLFYPFVSFFAIFSSVVKAPGASTVPDDLELLDFVVRLLDSPKYENSGADRLCRVARTFLDVARTVRSLFEETTGGTKRKRMDHKTSERDRVAVSFDGFDLSKSIAQAVTLPVSDFEQTYQTPEILDTMPWEFTFPAPSATGQEDGVFQNIADLSNAISQYPQDNLIIDQETLTNFDWMMWDQGLSWPID